MGKNIGTLGHTRAPLDLEFTYFDGLTVRVHPAATDAVEIEFLESGKDIDLAELDGIDFDTVEKMPEAQRMKLLRTMSQAQQAGYRAIMTALRRLIHPEDFDAYWDTGMAHGQQVRDRMADIRAITAAVLDATTDFPTGRPSASPPGPPQTVVSSADVSSWPVEPPTELRMALAMERGRPDIQEFYVMAAEQEAAEAAARQSGEERDQERLAAAGLAGLN